MIEIMKEFIKNWLKPRGTILYKYFPLKENNQDDLLRVRNVVEKNELYFSRLADFNDPFDCCPIYDAPPKDFQYWHAQLSKSGNYAVKDLEEVKNNWLENRITSDKLVESEKSKMQKAINEELGICCFSEKPDSLLMWAHYASFHTGVCFEFARTPNTPFFGEALQVFYKPNRPKVNLFKRKKDAINDAFLTKSSDWKYESEYRIIGPNRQPGTAYGFPGECLVGVILGAKMKQENENILKRILRNRNNNPISIKRAQLDDIAYKINIESSDSAL